MSEPVGIQGAVDARKLSLNERHEIDKKIEFETSKSFHSMVKLGAFANIIGAFFYVLAIYNPDHSLVTTAWYCTLFAMNSANVIWALRFEYTNITYEEILKCRRGFLYLLVLICLVWGSIGIIFMSDDLQQQMVTLIFLSAVLICFSFSTAIDLTMGISSIICLLTPTIVYHSYLAIHFSQVPTNTSAFDASIAAAFSVLGLFMLIACIIGNKIIIKMFHLSYENELLSKKLEGINILLESRVKERTEELEKSLKLVTYQSTHDLLTELPNERLLNEYLQTATERAIKNHSQCGIACFSVNGMVKINDSIGHKAATTIIHRIAQRFAQLFKESSRFFISLSRKDIFVIVIEAINDLREAEECVNQLFHVMDNPVYVAKQALNLTASIGLSVFPANGRDVDTLISNAEAARVLATQRGGNSICVYNTVINADASRQLNIENLLFHAIENNELILNYQPFIDLKTGAVCGAEALVRWQNPELGLVSPLDFIPVAETNGMILPIGEWVLRTACQQLKKWHRSGYSTFKISVNLSAKQLIQHDFVDSIAKILEELKVKPQFLELELVESNAFQNEAIPMINRFAEMGISLAIDDFGTGYSEFNSLKLFNVNKIKIDKSFIQDINVSIDSRNIVCNTIALAERMEIECLAEGVETIEQVKFLNEHGCHIMQGYYFSKPLSERDFFIFLKNYQQHAS